MEERVLFLPLTPGKHQKFQSLLGPLLADIIARFRHVPLDAVLNTSNSFRYFKKYYNEYLRQLGEMGIALNKVDFDESDNYYCYIDDLTRTLYKRGDVSSCRRDIAVCKCGRAELPMENLEELLEFNRGKIVSQDNRCKYCGTGLEKRKEKILSLVITQSDLPVNIIPDRYRKEFEAICSRLRRNPPIISRHTRAGQKVKINGEEFVLDADFRWMGYVNYLLSQNGGNVCLVAGSDCLNHAAKVICLSHLVNPLINYTLVIHPLIKVEGNSSITEMDIDDYLKASGDRAVARTFLSLGLQWTKERTVISSRELYLVKQSIFSLQDKKTEAEKKILDLADIPYVLNRSKMMIFLKSLRAKKSFSGNCNEFFKNYVSLI